MQVWILPMCCQKFNFKIAMFKIKTFLGTTWLVWAIIAHRLWLFSHSCECLDELFWRMVPRSTSEEPVEWPPADVDVFRMVLDCNVANGCCACLIDFIFLFRSEMYICSWGRTVYWLNKSPKFCFVYMPEGKWLYIARSGGRHFIYLFDCFRIA